MSKPEVFVLVPSYNHAPFIERCIKSIIKQTLQPAKLLVIDDGSRDDSVQIIERTLKDCPFPSELIVRKNKGLCATLNEGFSRSFGEYFAYLGSDDVWLPELLESRVKALEARPNAALAFGHAYLIDENDVVIDCTQDWTDFDDGDVLPMLLRAVIPASSSVVYRRSLLAKESWNENSILEDYELYLKLTRHGEFAFDKNILSAWRQHGSNVSGDFAKMLDEWLAAQNLVAAFIGIDETTLQQAQTRLKFNSALDFIRRGDKRRALRTALENWRGAPSLAAVGKTFFRLLIPTGAINRYRKNKRQAAGERYGTVNI